MARRLRPSDESELVLEDLFRAICADDVDATSDILRRVENVNDMMFGVYFTSGANRKPELIAYGAHVQNSGTRVLSRSNGRLAAKNQMERQDAVRNGATPLHVAAWKNSRKVAKLLLQFGASTSKKDTLGVSVFDRAPRAPVSPKERMRKILRQPAAPRDVKLVSFSKGRALIQFTMTRSKPPVDCYEIKDLVGDQSWIADSETGVDSFATDSDRRDGPKVCLFNTPSGSVISAHEHSFAVRARNVEAYWSDWTRQEKPVKSHHWVEEWMQDDEREERAKEQKEFEAKKMFRFAPKSISKKTKLLKLGSKVIGYVYVDEWFKRAREEQSKSATRIQAFVRGTTTRAKFLAVKVLQRFYRTIVQARNFKDVRLLEEKKMEEEKRRMLALYGDQMETDFYSGTNRNIHRSRLDEIRRKERQRLMRLKREKDRFERLKQCGYEFCTNLPTQWQ